MDDPITTKATKLAEAAYSRRDKALKMILDRALGPDGWTLKQVPEMCHFVERPLQETEVWWGGVLVGTITEARLAQGRPGDPGRMVLLVGYSMLKPCKTKSKA